MQTIYLDISNKGVVPTIYAKQGDVGRKFEVVFTDSGIPYSIPTNAKISIWYEGDSGVGNYTDIGENSAIAIGENKAVVELITQMLSEDGEGIVCLVMNAGNNQIGSWNIQYLCERVPGFDSEGAKEYYTAFSKAVESLKQVTENLTPEAIGAAPAGYGLGETRGKVCTDVDTAKEIGFYYLDSSALESVLGNFSFGTMAVERRDGYIYQTIKARGGFRSLQIITRVSVDWGATWEPWEYVNPPMLPGDEYRTTERWNGKAVYTKLINCKQLPSVGSTAAVGISASKTITQTIRAEGQLIYSSAGGGDSLPFYNPSYGEIIVNASRYEAKVTVVSWNGSVPAIEAWVRVWYVLD